MKHLAILTLTLLLAFALRLYPTLASGMPFSTDGWGPIRNAEGIVAHSPLNLSNLTIFDGYHNYWPAVSIFGAFLSIVAGLKPLSAMSAGVPMASALAVLIFYALVKRISGNSGLALTSALMLAVTYPYTLFTAGVTKEAYATPIYLTAMLLFISHAKARETLLFMIASAALVTAHHLTAITTAAILFSAAAGLAIYNFKRGEKIEKSPFLMVSALAIALGLYLEFYAYNGLIARITLTPGDVISALSYQAAAYSVALYLVLREPRPSWLKDALKGVGVSMLVLFSIVLCTRRAIIPGAPTLPSRYLAYAVPFVAAAPMAALGSGEILKGRSRLVPAFWISVLLGFEGYAIFGHPPMGLSLAYRVINLITIPLAMLCAAGICRLASLRHGTFAASAKLAASAILIIIAASNIYNVYASVHLRERYMGYFWTYTQPEFAAAKWLSENTNETAAGDVKFYYLLEEYFSLNVDVAQALKYFYGETPKPPSLLILYDLMAENGYVLYGGYSVDLPAGWAEGTARLNQIYCNAPVKIYRG